VFSVIKNLPKEVRVRLSQLFGRTLRKPPADAQTPGLGLAVRAGVIRPIRTGQYAYLPLGWRTMRRAERLVRQEMENAGGQEMRLPPVEDDLAAIAELARREIRSYRDLPRLLYQIQDVAEKRRGKGLLAIQPARLVEAYSLHADSADLNTLYSHIAVVWEKIPSQCGLEGVRAEAGLGEAEGCALLLPHPAGGDRLVRCTACGYVATAEAASFRLPPAARAEPEPVRPVETPDCATIADVAAYVGVETSQTLKAVFYAWERPGQEPTLVFVVIRGDLEVNEAKLRALLGGGSLHPASNDLIRAAGAKPGYASPVGLKVRSGIEGDGVLVVADRSIETGTNFVAGANREGYHLIGVNYPRDFSVSILADIAQAQPGHRCPHCEGTLEAEPAIEVGRCMLWGTLPAERAGVGYVDAEGDHRPPTVGSYRFDLSSLLATALEAHHDDAGLVWPPPIAPFDVHLVSLVRSEEERTIAERAYERLRDAGLEVLYDDRNESAGVKFADADLIGCPVRVTISRRSLERGGAETKARWSDERTVVPEDALREQVINLLDRWPGL